jgi:hypothetical protein
MRSHVSHTPEQGKALITVYFTDLALTPQTHTILEGIVLTNLDCADSEIREVKRRKKCVINLEFKSICLTGSEKFCTITERKNEGERLFRDVLPLQ